MTVGERNHELDKAAK
jgi:hypothetical protein